MSADNLPLLIMKLRFRRLEGPAEFVIRALLTHVDLRARRVRLQDNFLSRRGFDFVGNIGTRTHLPDCQRRKTNQKRGLPKLCRHAWKFSTNNPFTISA